MPNPVDASTLLNDAAARQLANTTKTPPQWVGTTPRWLVQLLPWTPVEAGVYRVNRVIDNKFAVQCSPELGSQLPTAFVDYEPKPREYLLNTVSTTVQISTRISDLYRSPLDQVKEQLRIAVERLKEKQEDELINNGSYGLINNVHDTMRVKPRNARPTPDDIDELLARVWPPRRRNAGDLSQELVGEDGQVRPSGSIMRHSCSCSHFLFLRVADNIGQRTVSGLGPSRTPARKHSVPSYTPSP